MTTVYDVVENGHVTATFLDREVADREVERNRRLGAACRAKPRTLRPKRVVPYYDVTVHEFVVSSHTKHAEAVHEASCLLRFACNGPVTVTKRMGVA